ncbi:MAG TPA: response regulator transcription factor [Pseudonocardia sp.]|uniref:response regulator n=1 Tax=Pseudonocardia sp. TaxID=60912 RepID=UPI002EDB1B7D
MEDVRKIRLLLVDDQPAVLRGLRMWLALEPDLMVVGEAATGTDVGELINSVSPDCILMDVEMPGLDGVDATAVVHALRPALPVVILSLHDDIETRVRAWIAGAAAFVAKHEVEPVLVRTIRDVVRWHRELGA